jgi:hypothetical protein
MDSESSATLTDAVVRLWPTADASGAGAWEPLGNAVVPAQGREAMRWALSVLREARVARAAA